ncbi:hypothetical protein AAG594_02520 [Citromicrobium bathyomarinum]
MIFPEQSLDGKIVMKIMRKGAAADHGVKSVSLDNTQASFDPDEGAFLFKQDNPVNDFSSTGSRHVYRVRLDINEYIQMTEVLRKNLKKIEDEEIINSLSESVNDFYRIFHSLMLKK